MLAKEYYPAFHGVIITLVYSVIKFFDVSGKIEIFTSAMILAFFALIPFALTHLKDVFRPILLIKGLSFGLTQVFIYQTLVLSNVSNTMIASLFGGIVVTVAGAIFLKESLPPKSYIGVGLAFLGSFIYFIGKIDLISISLFAFLAGLLQGATTTITRSNVKNSFSWISIIISNFFWGGIILTIFSLYENNGLPQSETFFSTNSFIVAVVIIFAQLSLFLMMKFSSTQVSASLSLTRIPTSFICDVLVFSGTVFLVDAISTLLITSGIALTAIFNSKKKQTLKSPFQEPHSCNLPQAHKMAAGDRNRTI